VAQSHKDDRASAASLSRVDDDLPALLLSFDLEDWHQLVHRRYGRADWDRRDPAFERQVATILALLDELDARATFFVLGMTAARYPDVVRRIAEAGHELACHGHAHTRVYTQSRDEFRADVEQALEAIDAAAGRRPLAYRAPAFSINRRTPWAYEVLAELGFRWDSSQYDSPRVPDRITPVPAEPFRLDLGADRSLWELPVPVWRRIPIGGGSYWRVLPTAVIRRGLGALGRRTAYVVLYFHPYEFDPEPLRAMLPSPTPGQRLATAGKSLWRNAGRPLVARRLREIARDHRLLSYDEAYDDIARRYGTRTRALSPQGVLV
jgi:polysaccharide deacetylase family protein (PEP-CTERM system associated)